MNPILSHLVIGAICFVAGIFVYRNNKDMFAPFASKIDDKFDELEEKLKNQIKTSVKTELKKK